MILTSYSDNSDNNNGWGCDKIRNSQSHQYRDYYNMRGSNDDVLYKSTFYLLTYLHTYLLTNFNQSTINQ